MTPPLSESNVELIHQLAAKSPAAIDLTRDDHAEIVYVLANTLVSQINEGFELSTIESYLSDQEEKGTLALQLAVMLAKSKLWVRTLDAPLRISVVFAVYKEHNRIRTRSEHPHGEDFLRKKVAQLEWLFEQSPAVSWELIIVDDGCPENSGGIAKQIIEENNLQSKARVLFLSEAI